MKTTLILVLKRKCNILSKIKFRLMGKKEGQRE